MTTKTFWNIVIKILGLLLFFEFLEILTQLFNSLTYIFVPNMDENLVWPTLFFSILILVFYLAVISLFLFKSSFIVDKLNLVKNTETEIIKIDLKVLSIITIAIIIIGGVIFINGFSYLCKCLYDYFKQENLPNYNPTISWIIFNSIKTLLGYLLMTNSKVVAKYASKQNEIE